MEKRTRDIIALAMVPGFGAKSINLLLKEVASPDDIFRMDASDIEKIIGRRCKDVALLRQVKASEEFTRELEYIENENLKVLCVADQDYPDPLKAIYDPPPVLFFKGNILPDDINAVAIVGARKCSLYGMQMAEKLAFDLAERGVTIVSGMARGIDSAAHRGALKAGGRTVAVMGTGFRHIYPMESSKIWPKIAENGAVVTEFTSDIMPQRSNFPQRNRIISALAKGIVVVEAAQKSGSLITVDFALEHGKEVFAVPGRADLNTSKGSNALIQNGAKLVTSADEILDEIRFETDLKSKEAKTQRGEEVKKEEDISEEEASILTIFKKNKDVHIDELCSKMNSDTKTLSEILLKLQIKGFLAASPGGRYIFTDRRSNTYAS